MASGTWYYAQGGQQLGPVTRESLEQMYQSGQLRGEDLVWAEGMANWQPAASLLGPTSAAPGYSPAAGTMPPHASPAGVIGYGHHAYAAPQQIGYGTMPEYAGFWLRFVAWIVDTIITAIPGCIIGGIIGAAIGFQSVSTGRPGQPVTIDPGFNVLIRLVGVFIGWLYFALFESSAMQATPGKMMLGLRVTDLNGQKISFARATGRYFGKILSALILLIGYFMAGFTERKQALHDLMASTLVVRKPTQPYRG
jgi:uncharacterized RDD family membrane protein YckC